LLNNSRRKTEGKIIFGTGSRGARLEKYLTVNYPFPSGWRSDILVRPGGKIGDICSLVRNKFIRLETTNVKIVFAGGVCNLTTKVRHAGGIEISYHRMNTCNYTIYLLDPVMGVHHHTAQYNKRYHFFWEF
jgi:hypothetical protein